MESKSEGTNIHNEYVNSVPIAALLFDCRGIFNSFRDSMTSTQVKRNKRTKKTRETCRDKKFG